MLDQVCLDWSRTPALSAVGTRVVARIAVDGGEDLPTDEAGIISA